MIKFSTATSLSDGKILQLQKDEEIEFLLTDSRKVFTSIRSVFFAIGGVRNDGHEYLEEMYAKGIRQFVVEKEIDVRKFQDANISLVESSIDALQKIVAAHRAQFDFPIVGVTGSNGKTIVKEWLYQLLSTSYDIIKNPGSYNSQLGVPLSVWQLTNDHNLGIFEAGISLPGEMQKLEKVIRPTIGIITNIGSAHSEGFTSDELKVKEKITLFNSTKTIIYCSDYNKIHNALYEGVQTSQELLGWGYNEGSEILLKLSNTNEVNFSGILGNHTFSYPFNDFASRENLTHCIVTLLHLGCAPSKIQKLIESLQPVRMRLEVKQGINQCQLVDDSYNNDLGGFQISLDFLDGLNKDKKTVILSDVLQSGLSQKEITQRTIDLLIEKKVKKFFAIGLGFQQTKEMFDGCNFKSDFYLTTDDFINNADWSNFRDEIILVKGGRVFQFEKIIQRLQKRIHGTVMSVDLEKIISNFNFFKSLLQSEVKLMVMVKALAYGSGSNEVASLLQYHKVDYLGVAYTDEGVDLRNNNIRTPIMVMNPVEDGFASLLDYNLEPEIYSLGLLKSLVTFLDGKEMGMHLKIDTGMNRLGLVDSDLGECIQLLKSNRNLKVLSIFSHLAGSDDSNHDHFTNTQFEKFTRSAEKVERELDVMPIRHLLNSSGILRFPSLQLDMVRLGIGLYGIDPSGVLQDKLSPVVTLKTVISQIKSVSAGESVGYGRKGVAAEKMRIATIAIGYADGFSRGFSQGKGIVLIRDKPAPVVGNVCMDMTMVDITEIEEASEGDEVIVFGGNLPIQEVAERISTIPYEVLTNTGERVKRVFYSGSF